MVEILALSVRRDSVVKEILRWIEFPPSATCDSGVVSWTVGFSSNSKESLAYNGELTAGDKFAAKLRDAIESAGKSPFDIEQAGTGYWPQLAASLESIVSKFAGLRKKYAILNRGQTLLAVVVRSLILETSPGSILPMCLREPFLKESPVLILPKGMPSVGTSSLPCPGYWPVTRVFVNKSVSADLVKAIQHALKNAKYSPTKKAHENALVQIPSINSTFARDYWINIWHGNRFISEDVSLSTTKANGKGYTDNSKVVNAEYVEPKAAAESGFGFGGNFLAATANQRAYLFTGHCNHRVGQNANYQFMIDEVMSRLRQPTVTLVKLDTGWLKVGHVDEILSFPASGAALIASPGLYSKIHKGKLTDLDLNKCIELKLGIIAEQLGALKFKVTPVPVWFAPVKNDPAHVTSTRGNAVNCIYIAPFSIHSQSGASDSEKRDNGASSAIDTEVAKILSNFGYTSLFVNMQTENDEGGAGGNVHCASYTTHDAI